MTSEHPKKACQETGTGGKVCWLVLGHPGRVHVDVTDGGLVVWSPADGEKFRNVPLNTEDPVRDAPEALKAKACGHILPCNCTMLFPGDVPSDEQQCASQNPRNEALFCTRASGHRGIHHNSGISWVPQVPLCQAWSPSGKYVCAEPFGHLGEHRRDHGTGGAPIAWAR